MIDFPSCDVAGIFAFLKQAEDETLRHLESFLIRHEATCLLQA